MRGVEKEVLLAEGLSKSYGDRMIIQNMSISLQEGELVSLLRVSGAGRSTLFNLVSGL